MHSRIVFFLVFTFWVTMTYLLWRSEYVGHNHAGSPVPEGVVWRKILSAPDNSSLQIMHHGKKVGYCRWSSNIGQDLVGKIMTEDASPDAPPPAAPGYQIDFEGNVSLDGTPGPGRLRFDMSLTLNTNNLWQDFNLRLNLRPSVWEVHSRAREQTVHLITAEEKKEKTETVFKFSDLQNPQALFKDLNLPAAVGMLGLLGSLGSPGAAANTPGQGAGSFSLGLNWKARNDWISIGHSSVRAYRLEASLLDRYRLYIVVSRVGEILIVQLPDEWQLVNDQLISL